MRLYTYAIRISFLFLFSLLLLFSSCGAIKKWTGIQDAIDTVTNLGNNTNQTLDRALDRLSSSAEDYEEILREAIDEVRDANIKAQLQSALENAVVTASTEIRCNIQFTADYLIHEVRKIKAELLNEDPPVSEPQICTVLPASIDMNLQPSQRNTVAITGYFLSENFRKYRLYLIRADGRRSDQTNKLTQSSDFKLIINLGNNGIRLSDNSSKLRLEWDGQLITEIPVIQRTPEPCRIRETTLGNLATVVLVPVHRKYPGTSRGDKDFNGNGPCTKGHARLYTKNNGRELWAEVEVRMYECSDDFSKPKSDYTYATRTVNQKLTTVSAGWRIQRIRSATQTSLRNIDKNGYASENVTGSGPILHYLITGDTDGSDVGSSRVVVTFRAIAVTLREEGECI